MQKWDPTAGILSPMRDNRRAFPDFLTLKLLLMGCGGGGKAGNAAEELHLESAEDR